MKRLTGILLALFFTASSSMLSGQNTYEILYLEGEFEEIISQSSQLNSPTDYYWNALVTRNQGEELRAMEILEKGIVAYPEEERLELLLTDLYYETGDYLKAKPLLQKYSGSHDMFIRLVELLEFQDSFLEAIYLLEQRLQSDTLNLSLLIHLGDNHFKRDSLNEAIYYYDKVFKLNPDDQATANKLASLLVRNKAYERSIEVCDYILERDILNKKFMRIKASASFSNQDYSTSMAYFKSLLALGDSGVFILKHLGISEFHMRMNKPAQVHLLSAYEKDPGDFEICFMLGRGFLNSTTPEKGLYYLEAADSLMQPDSSVMAAIYLEKKSIYYTISDYDRTLECYKKAYEYDPQPQYVFYMASMYQHTFKEKKLALEYYTNFLEMLPPPMSLADNPNKKEQITITMRSTAENAITELKEELFFEGKLE